MGADTLGKRDPAHAEAMGAEAWLGVLTAEAEVLDRFRAAADVCHDLAEQPAYHVPLAAGARRPAARRSRDQISAESDTAELGGRGKN